MAGSLATATLPDGRLELFVVLDGKLMSMWKQTAASDSAWTELTAFYPQPDGNVSDVAVGRLPDGRLELFVSGSGGLVTCWKLTMDPTAPWSNWISFAP